MRARRISPQPAGALDSSANWRNAFITSCLERDMPQLGPRLPVTTRHFLDHAEIAGSLAVDGKTVAKYLDLMIDVLLVGRLPPLHANVGKRLTKSRNLLCATAALFTRCCVYGGRSAIRKAKASKQIGLRELAMDLIGRGAGSA